jgi:hypothetical protein
MQEANPTELLRHEQYRDDCTGLVKFAPDGSVEKYALVPQDTSIKPLHLLTEVLGFAHIPSNQHAVVFWDKDLTPDELQTMCDNVATENWLPLQPPHAFKGIRPDLGEHLFSLQYALDVITIDGLADMPISKFKPYMTAALQQALDCYSCSVPPSSDWELPRATIAL